MQVNTIGDLYEISNKLPQLQMPHITFRLIQSEFSDALTIAILAAIESLLSAVVADSMINGRHRSNMELIALALASGVTPEKGIYTAIIAGFLVSFLGGSKVQIAGPTAAFATIVAGIVAKSGMDGLIVATIMAGISCGNDLHCHINHLAQTGKNQCDTGITYCSDCIDCAGQGIIYAGQYHWRSV